MPHEIISVRRWTARNVVADRYRSAAVFLAGDAAHLNHPASGLGLNTGLGDAVDLGWKLEATLAGWGGAGLLDSYEIERQPVGVRNVGHAEHEPFDTDRNQKPASRDRRGHRRRARAARREHGRGDRAHADPQVHHRRDRARLPLRSLPDLLAGRRPRRRHDTISEYHPTSYPGSRAPHAWLGDARSIIDAVRPRLHAAAASATTRPSRPRSRAPSASAGCRSTSLAITDPAIGALYERRLVLVRPDGHVAWRSDAPPADPLALVDRVRGLA